jgi:hypothetical protein
VARRSGSSRQGSFQPAIARLDALTTLPGAFFIAFAVAQKLRSVTTNQPVFSKFAVQN